MAGIDIRALSVVYGGDVRAVDDLELTIADGEFFALLGPSGCGKTTLLRTLAGLEQASAGNVMIGDRDVTAIEPARRNVAMVFQDYALFPHMTVAENIAYPLRVRGVPRARRRTVASDTSAELSLAGLLDRKPGQLSGGQQQRVALARAVAMGAEVLLLDEPLSNLDARLRLEARTFLKRLQRELAVTTVFVTHDQAEALAVADRIAVLDSGRLRQVGTPREVFQYPADTFVANFIGSTPMNLLSGRITAQRVEIAGGTIPLPPGLDRADGSAVTIGIRPEYLRLRPEAADGLRGRVSVVENLGVTTLVVLDCSGDVQIGVTVPEADEPAVGAMVAAVPEPGRILVFDPDSGQLLTTANSRGGHLGPDATANQSQDGAVEQQQ